MGFMQVFLNTRIRDNKDFSLLWGKPLNGLGNFFLWPVRFLFSGKTLLVNYDNRANKDTDPSQVKVAKVSSFFRPDKDYRLVERLAKVSKQDDNLRSTNWERGPYFILLKVAAPILLIPFGIAGVIFKGLSYCDPAVRKANQAVKARLTAAPSVTIGTNEAPVSTSEGSLNGFLRAKIMTGQKINELVIYLDGTLGAQELDLISKINPKEIILVRKNEELKTPALAEGVCVKSTISSVKNRDKWKKWDVRALGVNLDAENETAESMRVSADNSELPLPRKYTTAPRVSPQTLFASSAKPNSKDIKHTFSVMTEEELQERQIPTTKPRN